MTLLTDSVEVEGATIGYGVVDGDRSRPDLVLIHGNGAHHLWWLPVMQHLQLGRRLVLLDLSGHGDSSHRTDYRPDLWAAEVVAVMARTGSDQPVVVGHSMGGRVALTVAASRPDVVSGLVMIDSSVRPPERYRHHPHVNRSGNRHYATESEIRARFRLLPVQPPPSEPLPAAIVEHSIVHASEGWTWKHDPQALLRFEDPVVDRMAHEVRCATGYVYGSESVVVDAELAAYFASVVPAPVTVRRVEGAHHHVILDAPAESAAIIEDCASDFAPAPGRS